MPVIRPGPRVIAVIRWIFLRMGPCPCAVSKALDAEHKVVAKIAFFIARHSRSVCRLPRCGWRRHSGDGDSDVVRGWTGFRRPDAATEDGLRVIVLASPAQWACCSPSTAISGPRSRTWSSRQKITQISSLSACNAACRIEGQAECILAGHSVRHVFGSLPDEEMVHEDDGKAFESPCRRARGVSRDMVKQYVSIFGPGPYLCIYNVVCDSESHLKMQEPVPDEPWFHDRQAPVVISAGRLAPEKGFPDLIRAIGMVRRSRPMRLLILGEGPLGGELQELIEAEGLRDCARLVEFPIQSPQVFQQSGCLRPVVLCGRASERSGGSDGMQVHSGRHELSDRAVRSAPGWQVRIPGARTQSRKPWQGHPPRPRRTASASTAG